MTTGDTDQQRPNILLITCDQLRMDALGCYGNGYARTPNLDALAASGTRFDHYFTQSPVCQPSRASMTTGRYPRAHGVKYNWYDLPDNEVTLPGVLSEAGYSTWAVGKMHFEPLDKLHGFQNRAFIEGKLFVGDDEYRTYLRQQGKRDEFVAHARRWDDTSDYGASTFPIDGVEYIDDFIGRRGLEAIESAGEDPFFLWLSFVNPHMPYDPPEPWASMFDPDEIPLPDSWTARLPVRIPEHRTSSGGTDFHALDEKKVRQVRAKYFGLVSLVDAQIGRVLDAVPDNTVVIFTSDHGDFQGHRGMIWKGGKMLYDDLVRVPFIIRDPRSGQGGTVNSHLVESVDIMPTVLDLAGVDHPVGLQGRSLLGHLRGSAADTWRTWAFAEGLTAKMIRDHRWKLIMYGGRAYGEMYDLRRDPDELDNLFDDPRYATVRAELMEQLVHKLIETEDPLPRPTIRAGYSEVTGRHGTDELT